MNTLTEILPELRKCDRILVTGPQRSGTTIGAHVLAVELQLKYVDEDDFGIHDPNRALEFLKTGGCVVQGPGLMHVAEQFQRRLPGVVVVVMRRSVDEIVKSETRVGWRTAFKGANLQVEQAKYGKHFGIGGENIALIKYYCWDTIQKKQCTSFDLDYESLRGHPLWKGGALRKNFKDRQIA